MNSVKNINSTEWTAVRLAAGALISVLVVAAASGQGSAARDSCVAGYVWREAVPGDHVCVTPAMRAQVDADNRAAASRVAPEPSIGGHDASGALTRAR
jgi:hypothetical protein